jgi:hypothetical protein
MAANNYASSREIPEAAKGIHYHERGMKASVWQVRFEKVDHRSATSSKSIVIVYIDWAVP